MATSERTRERGRTGRANKRMRVWEKKKIQRKNRPTTAISPLFTINLCWTSKNFSLKMNDVVLFRAMHAQSSVSAVCRPVRQGELWRGA